MQCLPQADIRHGDIGRPSSKLRCASGSSHVSADPIQERRLQSSNLGGSCLSVQRGRPRGRSSANSPKFDDWRRNASMRLKGVVQMDDAYEPRQPPRNWTRRRGENAFRGRRFHDQRWQTRSDRPSPRRQVQQNGDRQICRAPRFDACHGVRCLAGVARQDAPIARSNPQRSRAAKNPRFKSAKPSLATSRSQSVGTVQSRARQTACRACLSEIRTIASTEDHARNPDPQARIMPR